MCGQSESQCLPAGHADRAGGADPPGRAAQALRHELVPAPVLGVAVDTLSEGTVLLHCTET